MLGWFDLIRIAVNADKDKATEYRDALERRAYGKPQEDTVVTIATNEDLQAFLRGAKL